MPEILAGNSARIKHCLAVNNGTDALILSLKALGISKGDEVITVSNTFYATVGAIVACGGKPVLVDCDERYQISNRSQFDRLENSISCTLTNSTSRGRNCPMSIF